MLTHNTTGLQTSGVDNIINAENMMISFATPVSSAAPAR